MNENLKDRDVLLIAEKGSNKVGVVTGMNEDGTPKSVKAEEKNEPEFLKIDKHGDVLENFLSNFMRQSKEPTHFHFFRVPLNAIENIAQVFNEMLKAPDNPANKAFLDEYKVNPEDVAKKEYQKVDESRIDWGQFEKLGITKEMLEQTNSLDRMLNWQKSPVLIPIRIELGDTIIRTDARLALRETPEGNLNIIVHAIRKEPELDRPFMGVRFTDEDKQVLRNTGNLGRLVELEPNKDQKMLAFVSVDKLTNELVALRADRIKIPNEIKGVTLDDVQKKALTEGQPVKIEGMTSKQGKPFDATVQINADRRGLEFKFDNANRLEQNQEKQNKQENKPEFRIPNKLLGVELNKEQQDKLRDKQTIYVAGMTDKAGQQFNAYINVDFEKGKLNFYKWNPDKSQKVTPDNNSKTQVSVNSEGKTNEATKNVNDPLKKGQTAPTEKQQAKQDEKKEQQQTRKSRSVRM